MERKVKLDEFITHNMTLAQVNEAIELMKRGGWYIRPLLAAVEAILNIILTSFLFFYSIRTVLSVSRH